MRDLRDLAERAAERFGVPVLELVVTKRGPERQTRAANREEVFDARWFLVQEARRLYRMSDLEISESLGAARSYVADLARRARRRELARACRGCGF